jgi:hypothetical protein
MLCPAQILGYLYAIRLAAPVAPPSWRRFCSVSGKGKFAGWKPPLQVLVCIERSECAPTQEASGVSRAVAFGAKRRDAQGRALGSTVSRDREIGRTSLRFSTAGGPGIRI